MGQLSQTERGRLGHALPHVGHGRAPTADVKSRHHLTTVTGDQSAFNTSNLSVNQIIIIMNKFNRRDSRGHHGSKRHELAQQHAHSRGSHAFTSPTLLHQH